MKWLVCLPPFFAIWLTFSSFVSEVFISRRVRESVDNWKFHEYLPIDRIPSNSPNPDQQIDRTEFRADLSEVILNVAVSWEVTATYVNTILTAIVSIVVTLTSAKYTLAMIAGIGGLVSVFALTIWPVLGQSADGLASTYLCTTRIRQSTALRWLVAMINIILLVATINSARLIR
jgi:hypothetical protein